MSERPSARIEHADSCGVNNYNATYPCDCGALHRARVRAAAEAIAANTDKGPPEPHLLLAESMLRAADAVGQEEAAAEEPRAPISIRPGETWDDAVRRADAKADFWKRTADTKAEMFHNVWVDREAERARADDLLARANAADAERDMALDTLAALQSGAAPAAGENGEVES